MKLKIGFTCRIPAEVAWRCDELGLAYKAFKYNRAMAEKELKTFVRDVDFLVIHCTDLLDASILREGAGRLKCIYVLGKSGHKIDVSFCDQAGIRILETEFVDFDFLLITIINIIHKHLKNNSLNGYQKSASSLNYLFFGDTILEKNIRLKLAALAENVKVAAYVEDGKVLQSLIKSFDCIFTDSLVDGMLVSENKIIVVYGQIYSTPEVLANYLNISSNHLIVLEHSKLNLPYTILRRKNISVIAKGDYISEEYFTNRLLDLVVVFNKALQSK